MALHNLVLWDRLGIVLKFHSSFIFEILFTKLNAAHCKIKI